MIILLEVAQERSSDFVEARHGSSDVEAKKEIGACASLRRPARDRLRILSTPAKEKDA
ncbi:MAG: hypothetical protein ACREB5_02695 [Sphingomonadaceae bacterium]